MSASSGRRSLFWPVAGAFLLAAVVGTLLQVLVVLAVVRPMERREARAKAELAVSGVAAAVSAAAERPRGAALDAILRVQREHVALRPSVLVVRLDDGGLVTSPPEFANILSRLARADSAGGPARGDDAPPGRSEVLASRVLEHGGARFGTVDVVRRAPRGPSPDANPLAAVLYVPIALIASGVAGFVLVRMLVRRLRALELLAARVAAGDLSVRVGDPGGDEIARVAAQLDRMTEKLAASRAELEENEIQRRQLFADITHELATPLTSIRGAAETLLDPQVRATDDDRTRWIRGVLEESGRMDRMLRDLIELARLEAGAPLQRERLDWAALCRNTIERFAPRYARAELALEWRGGDAEAWVEADGLRLEQVLDNLLVNALRYVPAGGRVSVTLGREAAARWRLVVSDDGPGLPADELPHVFERFYRGAGARGAQTARDTAGSGLGLAIVREIVERHGGAVRAKAATPHGLVIEVELPEA